jgi:hypothetical protein
MNKIESVIIIIIIDLMIEIQRTRTVKAKVVPENNRGDWDHFKITQRQYLSNIPGKHEIKGLQKTAILGNAHKLREVLM